MALMDTQNSGLYNQVPQQNQTLLGNPSTDPNAQDSWMRPSVNASISAPTSPSANTGISGGGGIQQAQSSPSQTASGTMLGQISAGNVGQYMPGGYDQNKFSDPNKHDPKYDVGRILSKYPPGPDGLRAAMQELGPMGYSWDGKDKITGPGVGTIDVGFAFGSNDPNQMRWGWMPQDGGSPAGPQGSMIGANNPFAQNNFLNQMFQQLQAQRQQYANQQFNPTGGYLPPSGGINPQGVPKLDPNTGQYTIPPPMQVQPSLTMLGQLDPTYLGGPMRSFNV